MVMMNIKNIAFASRTFIFVDVSTLVDQSQVSGHREVENDGKLEFERPRGLD